MLVVSPEGSGAFGDSYVPQVTPLSSAGERHCILPHEESPRGAAEGISFEEVRASQQWDALRRQLPPRFDQWLDGLAEQCHKLEPTFVQVTETVWTRRHELTGSLTETMVAHAQQGEYTRKQRHGPPWDRLLTARAPVPRTVETMVGPVPLGRP
jgi:hypothetical protein